MPKEHNYYVYILQCSDQKYYTGGPIVSLRYDVVHDRTLVVTASTFDIIKPGAGSDACVP